MTSGSSSSRESNTLLEVQVCGVKLDSAIGGVGTHISELFFFADVDVKIFFLVAETDNHALIDRNSRRDKKEMPRA